MILALVVRRPYMLSTEYLSAKIALEGEKVLLLAISHFAESPDVSKLHLLFG